MHRGREEGRDVMQVPRMTHRKVSGRDQLAAGPTGLCVFTPRRLEGGRAATMDTKRIAQRRTGG